MLSKTDHLTCNQYKKVLVKQLTFFSLSRSSDSEMQVILPAHLNLDNPHFKDLITTRV